MGKKDLTKTKKKNNAKIIGVTEWRGINTIVVGHKEKIISIQCNWKLRDWTPKACGGNNDSQH